MINSLAVLSLIASVAFAQQGSVIPTGISTQCSDYLKSLNEDSSMAPCTSSLAAATSAFAPGGSGASSPTASSISGALSTICTSNTQCPESTVTKALAEFNTACKSELTDNQDVIFLYDVLYTLVPLRDAICSKDDSGSWCLSSISKNVADASKADIQKYLVVQDRAVANSTTFCENNVAFAFLNPSLDTESLCKTCTRNILTSYINFESKSPYAPGMGNSKLLCGQSDLYDKVVSSCGGDFLQGAVQAAGGLSGGIGSGSNAAPSAFKLSMGGVVAAIFGVATLAFL